MNHLDDTGDWPYRREPAFRPPESLPEPEVTPAREPAPEVQPEPVPLGGGPAASPDPVEPLPSAKPVVAALPEVSPAEPESPAAEPEEEAAAKGLEGAEHAGGEVRVPDGYAVLEGEPRGERRSVAVVVGRFNGEITNRMLERALKALEEAGVRRDAVLVVPVPGAFELPLAALALAKTRRHACIVALGCVIRGETPHFDYVAGEAASGLQLAALETGVPVAFGVLTCETREQAEARIEKGAEAARTALEMADLFSQLRRRMAAARG